MQHSGTGKITLEIGLRRKAVILEVTDIERHRKTVLLHHRHHQLIGIVEVFNTDR